MKELGINSWRVLLRTDEILFAVNKIKERMNKLHTHFNVNDGFIIVFCLLCFSTKNTLKSSDRVAFSALDMDLFVHLE